ncbi:hypothetical protein CGZ60_06315 [Neisseria animalis]|nr:hypothetical protein CGZ60_06315 [Neisseria animalis]
MRFGKGFCVFQTKKPPETDLPNMVYGRFVFRRHITCRNSLTRPSTKQHGSNANRSDCAGLFV